MTKPISRKMAVDCLLHRISLHFGKYMSCVMCGEYLLPGQAIQFDHIAADIHEGLHEYQNLRPIHYDPCHKKKTARDIKDNAKVRRLANPKPSKHPMKSSGQKLQGRGFDKSLSRSFSGKVTKRK